MKMVCVDDEPQFYEQVREIVSQCRKKGEMWSSCFMTGRKCCSTICRSRSFMTCTCWILSLREV